MEKDSNAPQEPEIDLVPAASSPPPERTFTRSHRAAIRDLPEAPVIPFPEALWESFRYPLRNWGSVAFIALVSIGLNQFEAIANQHPILAYVRVGSYLLAALMATWMFQILDDSFNGKDVPTGGPDFTRPGDLIGDAWRFGAAWLASFWPVLLISWALGERGGSAPLQMLLNIPGAFFLPVALLLVSFGGTALSAFRYPSGFRALRSLSWDYLYCALVFHAARHSSALLQYLAVQSDQEVSRTTWSSWLRGVVRDPTTPMEFFWHFLWTHRVWFFFAGTVFWVYLSVVQMRVLALLLRKHRHALGWFRSR